MRRPLGDLLAKDHRVILIDRPGHGWSTRMRRQDSTPQIQARMIDEALRKLGIDRAVFVVHSWSGALGARIALDHPGRVAGLVMLAPVTHPLARRRRPLQRDHRNAGDRPAARLHHHAADGVFRCRGRRAQRLRAADHAGWLRAGLRDAAIAAPARVHRQCLRFGDAEGSGDGAGCALRRDQGAGHDHRRRARQDGEDRHPRASLRRDGAGCKADRAARSRPHGAERCAGSGEDGDRDDDRENRPGAGGRRLKRFRAKWIPVRVKKTRQNKKPELRF
ncbi:alpha/beta fold hydrolase [Bradyrhizobium sp. S3.14.4]